jgi:hypothetical protein
MHCPSLPAIAHDRQVPLQAVEQQTPCSQCPDAQSVATAQAAPGGFGPQLPETQDAPATQSASVAQVDRQPPAGAQAYGAQDADAPTPHVPWPSQRAACVTIALAQL